MNVLMATSWHTACGIADHASQAISAIQSADRGIHVDPYAEALDPEWLSTILPGRSPEVLWLNYHRGLHSRWTPEVTAEVKARLGCTLLITFHDTRGEAEPDDLQRDLHQLADAFVVHEPVLGLPKAQVIRQGIPAAVPARRLNTDWLAYPHQPILGTFGFNFPWKNFDRIAEVSAQCGWALMILSNNATVEDEARWRASNPHLVCVRGFQSGPDIVAWLSACDATIFAYECSNTGTSGAIRQGLATRKPVIAWSGCRQFFDLKDPANWAGGLRWCASFAELPLHLDAIPVGRCDPSIVRRAHQDSWRVAGQRYAAILRGL